MSATLTAAARIAAATGHPVHLIARPGGGWCAACDGTEIDGRTAASALTGLRKVLINKYTRDQDTHYIASQRSRKAAEQLSGHP